MLDFGTWAISFRNFFSTSSLSRSRANRGAINCKNTKLEIPRFFKILILGTVKSAPMPAECALRSSGPSASTQRFCQLLGLRSKPDYGLILTEIFDFLDIVKVLWFFEKFSDFWRLNDNHLSVFIHKIIILKSGFFGFWPLEALLKPRAAIQTECFFFQRCFGGCDHEISGIFVSWWRHFTHFIYQMTSFPIRAKIISIVSKMIMKSSNWFQLISQGNATDLLISQGNATDFNWFPRVMQLISTDFPG